MALNLHSLTNVRGARRDKMRVGCGMGSGKGKTCGRGHKGQYARSGHKHKPAFEGGQMRLIRRIPKRGFVNTAYTKRYTVVNLVSLERFDGKQEITPDLLYKEGILKNTRGKIKILGAGQLKNALAVKAHAFSQAARQAVEKAGGKCVLLSLSRLQAI